MAGQFAFPGNGRFERQDLTAEPGAGDEAALDAFFLGPNTSVATIARPDRDAYWGQAFDWVNELGSSVNLFASVDEVSPSDTDYAQSPIDPIPGLDRVEFYLSDVADAVSLIDDVFTYRIGNPDTDGIAVTVALVETGTVIASWLHDPAPTTPTTFNQALTSGQVGSIKDTRELRIRFDPDHGGVPDPAKAFKTLVGFSQGAASVTVTRPDWASVGDLYVIAWATGNQVMTAPQGFVQLGFKQNSSTAGRFMLYAKIITATEPSSWTWTLATSTTGNYSHAAYRWEGQFGLSAPVSIAESNASLSVTTPAVSPIDRSTLLVHLVGYDGIKSASSTGGMTSRGGIENPAAIILDERRSVAGSTGTRGYAVTVAANFSTILVPIRRVPARYAPASFPVPTSLRLVADSIPGSDGDAVYTWQDWSGNGWHAMSGAFGPPTLKRNILNGRSVVRFDGVNDALVTPLTNLAGTSAISLYVVLNNRGGVGDFIVFERSPNYNLSTIGFLLALGTPGNPDWTMAGDAGISRVVSLTTVGTTFGLFSGSLDKSLGTNEANGEWNYETLANRTHNINNANTFGTEVMYIGARAGTSIFLNSDVAEIVLLSYVPTVGQHNSIKSYFASQYGVLIANDSFTDTDGTSLYAHTPDSGGTWTKHASSTMPDVHRIASNRVHGQVEVGWALSYHSAVPVSADQDITIAFRCVTNNNHFLAAAARINTSSADAYIYGHNCNADEWQMYKVVGGTFTQLGSGFSDVLNTNTDHTLRLVVSGTSIRGYADGVLRVDVTDSSIASVGRVGLFMQSPGSSTTGLHGDTFAAVPA